MFVPVAGPLLLLVRCSRLPLLATWGCSIRFTPDRLTAMLAHAFASHRLPSPAPHRLFHRLLVAVARTLILFQQKREKWKRFLASNLLSIVRESDNGYQVVIESNVISLAGLDSGQFKWIDLQIEALTGQV